LNNKTIEIISISDIKGADIVTKNNPLISDIEMNALIIDIKENGVKEPITICRNLIIDGRNRVNACKELEINQIPCIILARNTSNQKKMDYVMSKETRRHQTPTQKTCRAVRSWNINKPQNTTQKEYTEKMGVSLRNFANAHYIYLHNKDLFDVLFDGHKIKINENKDHKTSDSLTAIVKFLKSQKLALEVGDNTEIKNKKEIETYNLLSNRLKSELELFKVNGLSKDSIGKAVKSLYKEAIELGYIESSFKKNI